MLRDVAGVRVGAIDGRGVAVADGQAADLRRGVQIRLEQRGRDRLLVGDVVEVRALLIERQPRAGIDVEVEERLDRCPIFGTIEAREDARARIGLRGGLRSSFSLAHDWP